MVFQPACNTLSVAAKQGVATLFGSHNSSIDKDQIASFNKLATPQILRVIRALPTILRVMRTLPSFLLFACMVQHCHLIPFNCVLGGPCMLCNSWLFHHPLLACILMFLHSCLKYTYCLPRVHFPQLCMYGSQLDCIANLYSLSRFSLSLVLFSWTLSLFSLSCWGKLSRYTKWSMEVLLRRDDLLRHCLAHIWWLWVLRSWILTLF